MKYRLEVRVNAGTSHRRANWRNDHLKVNLQSLPENGRANQELIEYLSDLFELDKRDISIVHGERSERKTISLENLDRETLVRQMDTLNR